MTLPIFGSDSRYSNLDVSILAASDRKVFIVRIVHESTILLRKITDINEGDAICRVRFFNFSDDMDDNESKMIVRNDSFYLFTFSGNLVKNMNSYIWSI